MNIPVSCALAALVMWGATVPAYASDKVNKSFWSGVAIEGYDPVAYFVEGKPREGKKEHSTEWKGATWRFSSAENLAAFQAEPKKYAPKYGGYCAWAVCQGTTAGIDPAAWKIVDGRLYLNYNASIQEKWEKVQPDCIATADKNWVGLSQ